MLLLISYYAFDKFVQNYMHNIAFFVVVLVFTLNIFILKDIVPIKWLQSI